MLIVQEILIAQYFKRFFLDPLRLGLIRAHCKGIGFTSDRTRVFLLLQVMLKVNQMIVKENSLKSQVLLHFYWGREGKSIHNYKDNILSNEEIGKHPMNHQDGRPYGCACDADLTFVLIELCILPICGFIPMPAKHLKTSVRRCLGIQMVHHLHKNNRTTFIHVIHISWEFLEKPATIKVRELMDHMHAWLIY